MGRAWRRCGVLVAVAVVVAGCGDSPGSNATMVLSAAPERSPSERVTDSLKTVYPLTVTGCDGHTSTFTSPPKTTVTMDPQAYELMFWLGLGQQQVAGQPQPLLAVPEQFKDATKTVRTIAKPAGAEYPTKEAILATAPDFVFGSYSGAFAAPSRYTEDELKAKGINAYYSFGIGGCKDDDPKAPRTTLDATFRDLQNLGMIFDVQPAALALEKQMRADLETALASVKTGTKVTVTTMGADNTLKGTPGYWGSSSTVNAIIRLAGGVNAFEDRGGAYSTTTLEEIIKRNPDVIVFVAYPAAIPKTWDDLEAYLNSTPALAGIPAVKNRRYARTTFPEVGAGGIRNVDGVKKVAAAVAAASQ